jgi:methylmalonyl-CoA mutase cobalamin-binding subunit
VAVVFWTWLWGYVGLLLATPLTVCLLVLGRHVPQLNFLNILLGSEPVFDPKTRVYQRLLAGDLEEALDLIEERLAETSLAEVFDTVLIPALALAEIDRGRGNIDEARHKFIFQSVKEAVLDLGERQGELPVSPADSDLPDAGDRADLVVAATQRKPCLLLLPARNEADEIAAAMLAKLLATSGIRVEAISGSVLASELADLIAERQADIVCISAMPPAAARHTRYLCKRLVGRFPEQRLVVGLWNDQRDLTLARTRIGCVGAVRVVNSLAQACEQIQAVLQPLMVHIEPPRQTPSGAGGDDVSLGARAPLAGASSRGSELEPR